MNYEQELKEILEHLKEAREKYKKFVLDLNKEINNVQKLLNEKTEEPKDSIGE